MSKRARSSSMSLTGGTNDVNPQYFKFPLQTSDGCPAAANTVNGYAATVPLPIGSFQQTSNGRATVMEILTVYFIPHISMEVGTNSSKLYIDWVLATGSEPDAANIPVAALRGMSLPRAIAAGHQVLWNNFNGNQENMWWMDLTDGAGHGVLVAAPTMSYAIREAQTGIAGSGSVVGNNVPPSNAVSTITSYEVGFLYRFKEVSLSEYIGIQQSQTVAS